MPDYWDAGAGYLTGAWHNKMPVFEDRKTASEAAVFGNMQFTYSTRKSNSVYTDANGQDWVIEVPNRLDLWRDPYDFDPEPRFIRTITNRYHILQPMGLMEIVDPLTPDWPVSTVGVVDDWKIMFVSLLMEPYEVGGFENETIETYLMASDDKGRPGAAHWAITTVRPVCYNTYQRALKDAVELHRIPHSADIAAEMSFRRDLAAYALKQRRETLEQFDAMIKFQMVSNEFDRMLEAAFPYKKEPVDVAQALLIPVGAEGAGVEYKQARAEDAKAWKVKRDQFADDCRTEASSNLERFNDEYPYAANTLWGGFNAITQQANHSTLYRNRQDEAQRQANILWGDRSESMNAAFEEALLIMSNN